jgi:hypothetical protein
VKKALVVAISIATLSLTPTAASAQAACAVGIIVAAIGANARDHRELTQQEANWCGMTYFFQAPQPQKKKPVRHAKKH